MIRVHLSTMDRRRSNNSVNIGLLHSVVQLSHATHAMCKALHPAHFILTGLDAEFLSQVNSNAPSR